MEIRLPVPHPNGALNARIRLPDSDAIIHAYDCRGRWSQIEDLLKFAVTALDGNPLGPHDIREMPVKSADSALKEIYLGFENEPSISWHPFCIDCGYQMHFRKQDGNPVSIHDFKCTIAPYQTYEECNHVVILSEPLQLFFNDINRGPVHEGTITEVYFSQPLIRDMIEIENDPTLREKPGAAARKLLKMRFAGAGGTDLIPIQEIQNRYIKEILNFKNPRDLEKALEFMLLYGIDPRIEITCPGCGEVQVQGVPFGNFFGSSLPGAR